MICQRLEHRMRQSFLGTVDEVARRSTYPLEEEIIEVVADMVCGKRFGE